MDTVRIYGWSSSRHAGNGHRNSMAIGVAPITGPERARVRVFAALTCVPTCKERRSHASNCNYLVSGREPRCLLCGSEGRTSGQLFRSHDGPEPQGAASSMSADVRQDNDLAAHYNTARVAIAAHDSAKARMEATICLTGAEARGNDVRVRQAHERQEQGICARFSRGRCDALVRSVTQAE